MNTTHLNWKVHILYYDILTNTYLFRVNNKALQRGVEYAQSQQ